MDGSEREREKKAIAKELLQLCQELRQIAKKVRALSWDITDKAIDIAYD